MASYKPTCLNILPAKQAITLPVSKKHQDFVKQRIGYIFGDLIRGDKTLERVLEDCYIQGMYDAMETLKGKPKRKVLEYV